MAKKSNRPPAVLCLIRHGDAGDPLADASADEERALSPKGRRQAQRAGKALARWGLAPDAVLVSPLRRARETARVATAAAGSRTPATPTPTLRPEATPAATLTALRGSEARAARDGAPPAGVTWLVGHEPHLSALLGHLLGAPAGSLRVGKGSVAVVEVPAGRVGAGGGVLVGLHPRATLES